MGVQDYWSTSPTPSTSSYTLYTSDSTSSATVSNALVTNLAPLYTPVTNPSVISGLSLKTQSTTAGNIVLNYSATGTSQGTLISNVSTLIQLEAQNNLTLNDSVLTAPSVTLDAFGGSIIQGTLGQINTTALFAQALNNITINATTASQIIPSTTGTGNICITDTNPAGVTLESIVAANGSICVNAAGTVVATYVVISTDATGNNVTIMNTSGDIDVDYIAVGFQNGTISLTAARNIEPDPNPAVSTNLVGFSATLHAGGVVGKLLTDLGSLNNFDLIENVTGDVTLNQDLFGIVDVTATGNIFVTALRSGGHSIKLTAGGNIYITYLDSTWTPASETNVTKTPTVTLTATGSIYGESTTQAANVVTDLATLSAGNGIGPDTAKTPSLTSLTLDLQPVSTGGPVGYLQATSGTGGITVAQTGSLDLGAVSSSSAATISATGSLRITDELEDTTNTTLSAASISTVAAGTTTAAGTSSQAGLVSGTSLSATTASGITLATSVSTFSGLVTGTGNIQVSQSSSVALTLSSVTTTSGSVSATAASTLTANSVVAGGQSDVDLTSTGGNVQVGHVTAGTSGATVTVTSTSGSIVNSSAVTNPLIIGSTVLLSASAGGIGTSRTSGAVNVSTPNAINLTTPGSIYLQEQAVNGQFADLQVGTISSTSGSVTLSSVSGSIVNTSIASLVSGNNVSLTATTGNVGSASSPLLVSASGSLSGTANNFSVQSTPSLTVSSIVAFTGNAVVLVGQGDASIDAVSAVHGNVTIDAQGSILGHNQSNSSEIVGQTLALTASTGGIGTASQPVLLSVSGSLSYAVQASANNAIFLSDTAGDLHVGGISSATDAVTLTSAGSILDGPVDGTTITLTATSGSIGTSATDLQIESTQNLSVNLYASAQGGVYITEFSGDLFPHAVVSTTGNVRLTVANGSNTGYDLTTVSGDSITASSGSVTLQVADNVTIGSGSTLTAGSSGQVTINGDYNSASASSPASTFSLFGLLKGLKAAVNGSNNGDEFDIGAVSPSTPLTVNGNGQNDIFNVSSDAPTDAGTLSNVQGTLNIVAGAGSYNQLIVSDFGDTSAKTVTVTSGSITGFAAGVINYSATNGASFNDPSGSEDGIFLLSSQTRSATFDVQSTLAGSTTFIENGGATLTTGGAVDTYNIGSSAPTTGGIADNIQGALTVGGAGADTMNVDDSGSTGAKTGALSSMTVSDPRSTTTPPATIDLNMLNIGTSGITSSGLANLNINLGSGGNTFTVSNTARGTTTTVNSGTGKDTVNVTTTSSPLTVNTQTGTDTVNIQGIGAAASVNGGGGNDTFNVSSSTGTLSGVKAVLTINGGTGSSTANVSDTGDGTASNSNLNGTTLTSTAFGSGGRLSYSGLATLNLSMGSGGNIFTVANTAGGTTTTVNSGTSSDTVDVTTTSSPLTVNTQTGTDTVNIQGIGAAASVNGGGGNDIINVSSNAPSNSGQLSGIAGVLTIEGGTGSSTANVSDTGDGTPSTFNLTDTTLSSSAGGFGSGGSITFGTLAKLNVSLGSGGNTVTVANTDSGATTVLNSGSGTDMV